MSELESQDGTEVSIEANWKQHIWGESRTFSPPRQIIIHLILGAALILQGVRSNFMGLKKYFDVDLHIKV